MNTQVNVNKRFFIKTLGCKVNQYESQAMREILLKSGFRECLSKETADVYIVNTCTVTHKADSESRHWAPLFFKTNPKARIVLTGCGVGKDADRLSYLPGVSNVVRNEDKGRIAEILTNSDSRRGGFPPSGGQVNLPYGPQDFLTITDFKDHTKAFVKIQDGCDNFCAYCKVPHIRGALSSKPLKNVAEEVTGLVSKGFREIVLTGICLGAWGSDLGGQSSLVDVLKAVHDIQDDFRVRLSSIEPKYVTPELIDYMALDKRVCRHLHIPVQSGDDDILRKMNRPYTAGSLKELIIKIRNKMPSIGITTDVLIGFPGESDNNFRNTVNFIKEIRPVRTHIFPFSKREGTAACSMNDMVPGNIIKQRFERLRIESITASYLYREAFLGKQLDVLVESGRDKHFGRLIGYSDNYIKVMMDGPNSLMRKVVPVMIEELNLSQTIGTCI